jgi:hypothetical protein
MMSDGRDGAYLFHRLMMRFRWTRQAPTAGADCLRERRHADYGRERR